MSDMPDDFIDSIVDDALARRLDGEDVDLDAVVADHPEQAEKIRARLADLRKIEELWHAMSCQEGSGGDEIPESLPRGTQLGDFELHREIGRGGMGTVYLAQQGSLGRTVALKVISNAGMLSSTTRARFLREAQALASLSHPNIVPVIAAGEADGSLYMAMEYVDGVSLSEIIHGVRERAPDTTATQAWQLLLEEQRDTEEIVVRSQGRPAAPDGEYVRVCCRTIIAVAAALDYAHTSGIIHRDVKPGNIIIGRDGRPRLVDFGLAAVRTQPHVTMSGEFFGTPNYTSPEQARGRSEQIDARTDVYSLGATLYECLALVPPFIAPSAAEVLSQVIHTEPRPLRRANPSLPRDLDTVTMKAMARLPGGRYSSPGAFADDLQRVLEHRPILARPVGLPSRLFKRIRRQPLVAGLVAASLLAVCVAVSLYVALGGSQETQHRLRTQADVAEQTATESDRQARGAKLCNLAEAYDVGGVVVDGVQVPRDRKKAVELFRQAAELGVGDAMWQLSNRYLLGRGVEKDRAKAMYWQDRGARAGHVRCMAMLGAALIIEAREETKGVEWPKDAHKTKEGIRWLQKAAEADDLAAMKFLSKAYMSRGEPGDREEAVSLLRRAAEKGSAETMYQLGIYWQRNASSGLDSEKARQWYLKAAGKGHIAAMTQLGKLYRGTSGIPRNPLLAKQWFEKAAAAGSAEAAHDLGHMLLFDDGIARNASQAKKWFKEAAVAGRTDAMEMLGLMYQKGEGGPRDVVNAKYWFLKGAQAGKVYCMVLLASLHLQYGGQPDAHETARKWLLKASDQGDARAAWMLGGMDLFGQGGPLDFRRARKWFALSVQRGYAPAMTNLGSMYVDGLGGPRDLTKGVHLLRSGAEQGDPTGMVWYGRQLERGEGVGRNAQAARSLYEKAALKGSVLGMSDLGRCLLNGIGTKQDLREGIRWLSEAAERGEPGSMVMLGTVYGRGLGVSRDIAQATSWYAKAAKAGEGDAMIALALQSFDGFGVPRNSRLALSWLHKYDENLRKAHWQKKFHGLHLREDDRRACRFFTVAAEQGNITAMRLLGECLEQGIGTEKDLAAAERWYRTASEHGDDIAKGRLASMVVPPTTRPTTRPRAPVRGIRQ